LPPHAHTAAPVVPARRPFLARSVTIGMPAAVVVVLSLVAGGLQVANQILLKSDPQIQGIIAVFLVFLVGIGVSPVTGVAFRNLIHLPPWALTLITAIVSALTGALQIVALSVTVHTVIATLLTILASLGFGASQGSLVPVAAPHR
jgi:hypothetical protein